MKIEYEYLNHTKGIGNLIFWFILFCMFFYMILTGFEPSFVMKKNKINYRSTIVWSIIFSIACTMLVLITSKV